MFLLKIVSILLQKHSEINRERGGGGECENGLNSVENKFNHISKLLLINI